MTKSMRAIEKIHDKDRDDILFRLARQCRNLPFAEQIIGLIHYDGEKARAYRDLAIRFRRIHDRDNALRIVQKIRGVPRYKPQSIQLIVASRLPKQGQTVGRACYECKTRKIKCNGKRPCDRCRKYGGRCQDVIDGRFRLMRVAICLLLIQNLRMICRAFCGEAGTACPIMMI